MPAGPIPAAVFPTKRDVIKRQFPAPTKATGNCHQSKKKKGEIIITQSRNGGKYGRSEI